MIESLIGGGIAGVANLVAAGVAARNSAKANQAAQANLEQMNADNEEWWRQKQNESYLESAEGQAAMNKAKEMAQQQLSQERAMNAVMGGGGASLAGAQAAANSMLSDTMSNVVQTGEARKTAAEQQYLAQKNSIGNQITDLYKQKAANSAAAGSSALQSLGGIGSSIISSFGGK